VLDLSRIARELAKITPQALRCVARRRPNSSLLGRSRPAATFEDLAAAAGQQRLKPRVSSALLKNCLWLKPVCPVAACAVIVLHHRAGRFCKGGNHSICNTFAASSFSMFGRISFWNAKRTC
jgi:hypothetical protein